MANGLDPGQLLRYVVRPALSPLSPGMRTVAAEQLVMGTAAHESGGFVWLHQHSNGPAIGLWQMEPTTFNWLRDAAFSGISQYNIDIRAAMSHYASRPTPDVHELAGNLFLGAIYCRARYLVVRTSLPARDDVIGMAHYWKDYYNSALGSGKPEDYERAWARHIAPLELWRGVT